MFLIITQYTQTLEKGYFLNKVLPLKLSHTEFGRIFCICLVNGFRRKLHPKSETKNELLHVPSAHFPWEIRSSFSATPSCYHQNKTKTNMRQKCVQTQCGKILIQLRYFSQANQVGDCTHTSPPYGLHAMTIHSTKSYTHGTHAHTAIHIQMKRNLFVSL